MHDVQSPAYGRQTINGSLAAPGVGLGERSNHLMICLEQILGKLKTLQHHLYGDGEPQGPSPNDKRDRLAPGPAVELAHQLAVEIDDRLGLVLARL